MYSGRCDSDGFHIVNLLTDDATLYAKPAIYQIHITPLPLTLRPRFRSNYRAPMRIQ